MRAQIRVGTRTLGQSAVAALAPVAVGGGDDVVDCPEELLVDGACASALVVADERPWLVGVDAVPARLHVPRLERYCVDFDGVANEGPLA